MLPLIPFASTFAGKSTLGKSSSSGNSPGHKMPLITLSISSKSDFCKNGDDVKLSCVHLGTDIDISIKEGNLATVFEERNKLFSQKWCQGLFLMDFKESHASILKTSITTWNEKKKEEFGKQPLYKNVIGCILLRNEIIGVIRWPNVFFSKDCSHASGETNYEKRSCCEVCKKQFLSMVDSQRRKNRRKFSVEPELSPIIPHISNVNVGDEYE